MRRHHYRIVNPLRFFMFIFLTVMILVFSVYASLNVGHAEASSVKTYAQVVIHEGDTLWDIASDYNPERSNIREIVYEIYDVNDIDANDVQPGDTVFVPVY